MSAEDMDELTESIRRQVIENIVARIPNILAAQGFTIVPHGLSPNSPSDARWASFSTIKGAGSTLRFAAHEECHSFKSGIFILISLLNTTSPCH